MIASRKKLIARVSAFEQWFAKTVPNKAVRLDVWRALYRHGEVVPIPPSLCGLPVDEQISRGVVACFGGWLTASPMYHTYKEGGSAHSEFMGNTDGLRFKGNGAHLFSGRCNKRVGEKREVLDRIETVLRYHRKKVKEARA